MDVSRSSNLKNYATCPRLYANMYKNVHINMSINKGFITVTKATEDPAPRKPLFTSAFQAQAFLMVTITWAITLTSQTLNSQIADIT